ncbi:hypothetical protein AOC36_05715 [Erysipelothrix larvae]|uniref:MucBP domain-containing protein n=1 Tax=Erysipelothrix larvae TaxID=1514105 RepID=A0A109UH34_9FIRM|nr:InlB B-repeat-containing protein [Erysipelothrix larvae]AMC93493.1 hypothetical protein AOC36_05715 [Erysipelothrix larvae]
MKKKILNVLLTFVILFSSTFATNISASDGTDYSKVVNITNWKLINTDEAEIDSDKTPIKSEETIGLTFSFELDVYESTLKEGDYFSVQLPEIDELTINNTDFTHFGSEGDVQGLWRIYNGKLEVEFSDSVEGTSYVSTSLTTKANVFSTTVSQSITKDIEIGGILRSISFDATSEEPTARAPKPEAATVTYQSGKEGTFSTTHISTTIGAPTPEYTGSFDCKDGYEFLRWDPEVKPTVDAKKVTYTAIWVKKATNVTVTYSAGLKGKFDPQVTVVNKGSDTPAFEGDLLNCEPGYIFDSWSPIVSAKADENVEYVANWKVIPYTITYVNPFGSNVNNPSSYTVESEILSFNEPTRNGYNFLGWYNGEEKVESIPNGSTGNLTLEAKWELKRYTITYQLNGGTNHPENPSYYTQEDGTIQLKDPTREGYEFLGWYNGRDLVTSINSRLKQDIILKAQWRLDKYTITYELDGGTNHKDNPTKYTFESNTIRLHEATRKGYTFLGWYNGEDKVVSIPKGSTGHLTLVAKWQANPYTITYKLGGGTNHKDNPTSYTIESDTIILQAPTRKGYDFEGWFNGKDRVYSIRKGSTGNLELFAKWSLSKYTITYVLDGGTNHKNNPTSYTMESNTIKLQNPTRLGYDFVGWYNEDNQKVDTIRKGSTGHITLVAKWKVIPYKITYVNPYGSKVQNPTTYTVETTIKSFNNPTRKGYTFLGWYNGEDRVVSIPKGTTGHLTLVAKWEANPYTITYKLGGGTNHQDNPTSYTIESNTIILQAPTRKGYDFVGWYNEQNQKVDTIRKGSTGNITLVAKWKVIPYKITYVNPYGSKVQNPTTYTVETTIKSFNNPTRKGYTFLGWYNGEDRVVSIPKGTTGHLTLVAKWEANPYTITYKLGGGTNHKDNPTSYTIESDTIILQAPTRKGYDFEGWFNGKDRVYSIRKGSTGNVELFAKWSLSKYTITYVLDGGTNHKNNPTSYTMESNTIKLQNPTRLGYDFVGWYNGDNQKVDTIRKGSTGHITLVAKWKVIPYKITYVNPYGSKVKNPSTYTIETGVDSFNNPTRKGYDFEGWYNGENRVVNIPKGTTGHLTLVAKWSLTKYTITYVLGGGTNHQDNPTSYTIESNTIRLQNPTRKGYDFAGWFNGKDRVDTIRKGSTGNIELVAKWVATRYQITYVNPDGSKVDNPKFYTIETGVKHFNNPTRKGYTFLGWYDGENKVVSIPKGSTGHLTLVAKWQANVYPIKYVLNGGRNSTDNPKDYTYSIGVDSFADPVRKGYTFVKWVDEKGRTVTEISSKSMGPVTLKAVWKVNEYSIEYVLDGGVNAPSNPTHYVYGKGVKSFENPTKDGFKFIGWVDENLNPVSQISKKQMGDVTLYAVFEAEVYSINYELNGGVNDASNPSEYTYGIGVDSFVAPTRDGYTFMGWLDVENNSIESISKEQMGDVTLVATWLKVGKPVVVVYEDENGVELNESVVFNGHVGDAYESAALEIVGYTLSRVDGNVKGEISDEDQIVRYVYTKNDEGKPVGPQTPDTGKPTTPDTDKPTTPDKDVTPKPDNGKTPSTDTSKVSNPSDTSKTPTNTGKLPATGLSTNFAPALSVLFGLVLLLVNKGYRKKEN